MLFVIDDSVADILSADENPAEGIIEALQLLASAYRRGSHLITASRTALATLKDCGHLSSIDRSVYLKILNELPMTAAFDRLSRKALVVAQPGILDSYVSGQCRVIRISANYISRRNIAFETVFLSENLTDICLYTYVARVVQVMSGMGAVALRYEAVGGGGSTTVMQYQTFQDHRNRLCICIVDSDRDFPEASIGNTAREIENADDPNQPLCEQLCLGVRETENLIPTRMYSEALDDNPDQMRTVAELERLDASHMSNSHHFLDFKSGIKLVEIIGPEVDHGFADYWSPVFAQLGYDTNRCWSNAACSGKADCTCVVFRLGQSVLTSVVERVLTKNSIRKLAEMVDELSVPEWNRLGELITAWLCGRHEVYSA